MFCKECGNEIKEGLKVCENCGSEVTNFEGKKGYKHKKKIRFKVSDVVNAESVLKSTNKVAYIANGWALQVRKRGADIAVIIGIIFFFIAMEVSDGNIGETVFLSMFGSGILYSIAIVIIFNTTAFIIRMGAEVIQLLEDIKQNKEN